LDRKPVHVHQCCNREAYEHWLNETPLSTLGSREKVRTFPPLPIAVPKTQTQETAKLFLLLEAASREAARQFLTDVELHVQ
jgi:hypothetical protein